MTQHFAASWLQSLEKKLEALIEWSWQGDQRGECTTHRNLFREFFNPKFQKTLALVDDKRRSVFLSRIEQNLYKFEGRTQQFPLGCLCALLQHGKESVKTQEKVAAWVTFLLGKLQEGLGIEVVTEVVEELLSPAFQKFVSLMQMHVMDRLCDGLGEHLVKCDEDMQKRVMENFAAVPERIERIMRTCTEELNGWLETAPRFPATPLVLSDALSKIRHPLVGFFNRIKDANVKEAFLVSVALALQGLRTRFRWMCAVEPELEVMGSDMQAKLFTVEGQGPVMEMWLSSRLRKYNLSVSTKAAHILGADPGKSLMLKAKLQPLFPERSEFDPNSGWVALDGPSKLADALLSFLVENDPKFFCPQHTMARETLMGVLNRFGPIFESDTQRSRVRLVSAQPLPPAQLSPPQFSPPPFPPIPGEPAESQALVPAPQGLVVMPPPPPGAPPVPFITLPGAGTVPAASGASASEVDNLVDLLLQEELAPVPVEIRSKISKMSNAVYRFGDTSNAKEVTLYTQAGRLFVSRVGMMVRNCPLKMLLQEEGLVPTPAAPSTAVPAATIGGVDASSVAKIASLSARISAGVTTTTATPQQAQPFTQKSSDQNLLMSKRVEAATRAMDVSKQIVRRSINFDDEKFLRKLLAKGVKHDKNFSVSYSTFCESRGITDLDIKKQDRELVAMFIERNLASSINEEWAQKVIHDNNDEEKKEKKEKKKKDKKEKKDKKRKASDSGSSSPERQEAVAQAPPTMQPPAIQPPAMQPPPMQPPPMMSPPPMDGMSMGMGMYPPGMHGFPGMGGMMGMGGMVPPFGPGMVGAGMPPMGMDMMDDSRTHKKTKAEKEAKKARKASKADR